MASEAEATRGLRLTLGHLIRRFTCAGALPEEFHDALGRALTARNDLIHESSSLRLAVTENSSIFGISKGSSTGSP
jgi:hypothetical protein